MSGCKSTAGQLLVVPHWAYEKTEAHLSDILADLAPQSGIDFGALARAIVGISAAVLGGLMYTRPWAQDVFSILMIVAAVSAVYFSWKHSAWVTGHWLAMVPVTGVILGYVGWQWGYTLA